MWQLITAEFSHIDILGGCNVRSVNEMCYQLTVELFPTVTVDTINSYQYVDNV